MKYTLTFNLGWREQYQCHAESLTDAISGAVRAGYDRAPCKAQNEIAEFEQKQVTLAWTQATQEQYADI